MIITLIVIALVSHLCSGCAPKPPPEEHYLGTTPGGIAVYDELGRKETLDFTIVVEKQMNARTGITLKGYYVYWRAAQYLDGNAIHGRAGGWTVPEAKAIELANYPCLGHSALVHELAHGYQYELDGDIDGDHENPEYWWGDPTGHNHGLSIEFGLWALHFYCPKELRWK